MNKYFFSHPTSNVTRITVQDGNITVTLDLDEEQRKALFRQLAHSMSRTELSIAYAREIMERDGVTEEVDE